jgi:hypothetical protein
VDDIKVEDVDIVDVPGVACIDVCSGALCICTAEVVIKLRELTRHWLFMLVSLMIPFQNTWSHSKLVPPTFKVIIVGHLSS